jgi:tRNA(Met) cytidine acetyltransferase
MWQALSSSHAVDQLRQRLEKGHRGLVSMTGTLAWALHRAAGLFEWAGLDDCKYVSLNPVCVDGVISPSIAYQYLGRQFEGLFFDLSAGLKPDALAALAGCVGGGGLICVYWGSSLKDHPMEAHLQVEGGVASEVGHRLRERLLSSAMECAHFVMHEMSGDIELSSHLRPIRKPTSFTWTDDQTKTLKAILKVSTGRRRRPLLMQAPRGRGKSTVLAEGLIQTFAHKACHVMVVMPHAFSSLPLLKSLESHFSRTLKYGVRHDLNDGRFLTLLTMEQAISGTEVADVIFVDEAACFPIHVLLRFVEHTSRVVFSTTTAGYEGTGQGFRLRFEPELQARYPERRRVELDTPVRWQAEDPVEGWLNYALCLKLSILDGVNTDGALSIEQVSREELIQSPAFLESVYGLLVRAHHRTTPSDLQRILDAPNLNIWIARTSELVVGVCVIAAEGGLPQSLVEPIYNGVRRPNGHFLPETLSVHGGMKEAPLMRFWRIIRIAVDGSSRRKGVGGALLKAIESDATKRGIDVLGASFGATEALLLFWRSAKFRVVRIGVKRGRSSGLYSAVVLKALSSDGNGLATKLSERYTAYFPECLGEGLRTLEWPVARALFQDRVDRSLVSSDDFDMLDLKDFVEGRRSFEIVSPSLKRALAALLSQLDDRLCADEHWAFVIQKIFQHRSWTQMALNGQIMGSRGLAHRQLRRAVEYFVAS